MLEKLDTDTLLKRIHGDKVRHHFVCPKHGSYSCFLPPNVLPENYPHPCPVCEYEIEKAMEIRSQKCEAFRRAYDVVSSFFSEVGVCRTELKTFFQYVPDTPSQAFAKDTCERFANNFLERYFDGNSGVGIRMVGSFGTGKTHLASAILYVLKKKGVPGILVKVADLMDALNADPQKVGKRIGELSKVSCLVLDDLGASTLTDSEQKRIYQIVDARQAANLPTVFTTNLDGEDFVNAINGRVVSRIEGITYKINIEGEDFRRNKVITKKDLLGE